MHTYKHISTYTYIHIYKQTNIHTYTNTYSFSPNSVGYWESQGTVPGWKNLVVKVDASSCLRLRGCLAIYVFGGLLGCCHCWLPGR